VLKRHRTFRDFDGDTVAGLRVHIQAVLIGLNVVIAPLEREAFRAWCTFGVKSLALPFGTGEGPICFFLSSASF
jgi:hypothetical protein